MLPEFVFNDEHAEFEQVVTALARRRFADDYLARATSEEFPRDELAELGRHGLLDLGLSAEAGGQGADPITIGLACEQIAWADFNLAYLVFGSQVAPWLAESLDPAVGLPIAQGVARGERVVALALTEPRGGSDAARPTLRARAVPGGFRLTGEKTSVTLGAHASDVVVLAAIDSSADDPRHAEAAVGDSGVGDSGTGGSAGSTGTRGPSGEDRSKPRPGATRRFLVPLPTEGVTIQRFADPGFRPLSRVAIAFDDAFVAEERVFTDSRSGIAALLSSFDLTRTLLGLMCIGAARRALDITAGWVTEREAFGRTISHYQGVSFPLAEHDTKLEAARWLAYRALALRAAGRPHTREAAMIKWWVPRLAMDAINDCIVLHGHVGWSTEMPLVQMMLDVSGLQIGDGTPQIQKLVIARQMLGREHTG